MIKHTSHAQMQYLNNSNFPDQFFFVGIVFTTNVTFTKRSYDTEELRPPDVNHEIATT